MSLGMSDLEGSGEGGHLGPPPLTFQENGVGVMEELFGCTLGLEKRGRAESGAWVRSKIK